MSHMLQEPPLRSMNIRLIKPINLTYQFDQNNEY